jgi:hypothetical protein
MALGSHISQTVDISVLFVDPRPSPQPIAARRHPSELELALFVGGLHQNIAWVLRRTRDQNRDSCSWLRVGSGLYMAPNCRAGLFEFHRDGCGLSGHQVSG